MFLKKSTDFTKNCFEIVSICKRDLIFQRMKAGPDSEKPESGPAMRLCFIHTLFHCGLGDIFANGGDVQSVKAQKDQQDDYGYHQSPQGQKPYALFFVVQSGPSWVGISTGPIIHQRMVVRKAF